MNLKKTNAKKTSQPSIKEALTTKDSLNFVNARLSAVDRISLKTLESSVDIQEGLRARTLSLVDPRVDQLKKIAPFYNFLGPSRVSESNELVIMLVL